MPRLAFKYDRLEVNYPEAQEQEPHRQLISIQLTDRPRIGAREFDERFDRGEDVSEFMDFESSSKIMKVEVPIFLAKAISREAVRRGVSSNSLILSWIEAGLSKASKKSDRL